MEQLSLKTQSTPEWAACAVLAEYEIAQNLLMERAEELKQRLWKLQQIAEDIEAEVKSEVHRLFPELPNNDD